VKQYLVKASSPFLCPRRYQVTRAEEEMRVLLKAMEAQRVKTSRDVSQLAKLCDEWRSGG